MTCVESFRKTVPDVFAAARLERVFNECFTASWNTRLVGGAEEPLYQPAQDSSGQHVLRYRADYFASALHEVAHWCIAGERRRRLLDFGYWYAPEGRDLSQQRAFEAVECKPQALEWFFSRACGYRFRVSADNLELAAQLAIDALEFQGGVLRQAQLWQSQGLPLRAGLFYRALCAEFATTVSAEHLLFSLADLQ
jgi:elongation factor P hydroxylase